MAKGVFINPVEGTQNSFFSQNKLSLECVAQGKLKTQLLLSYNLNAPTHDCQDVFIKGMKSLHCIMKGLCPRSYVPHVCLRT